METLEVRKTVRGADFYNPILQGTSMSVRLQKADVLDITVVIVENEIRSFQVFKNIEFNNIALTRVGTGFKVGLEANGKESVAEFSLE